MILIHNLNCKNNTSDVLNILRILGLRLCSNIFIITISQIKITTVVTNTLQQL